MTAIEASDKRQAHIQGLIDQLTADIGAYLTPFAENERQVAALPREMARLQEELCRTWNEFRDEAYDRNTELWVML